MTLVFEGKYGVISAILEGHPDIMYTFSRVVFGSSEKIEIYLFLQSLRTKMNDIIIVDDCRYVPLPNSASNVKFGFALDVGSEVEIGLFSL